MASRDGNLVVVRDLLAAIEYEMDFERRRFERLVGANGIAAVEELLQKRPELATDPFAFWSEGILSMPANRRHFKMLELLMRHGARVPDMSKWGPAYYFKHDDVAAFLIERGMNARHMNCHRTTLLHEMARVGEIARARLLLDRGADREKTAAEWATPRTWARNKGHREVERLLG